MKVYHSHDRIGGKFRHPGPDRGRSKKPIDREEMRNRYRSSSKDQPSHSSRRHNRTAIFRRLKGEKGTTVIFHNLGYSVKRIEVEDLCRVLGKVKDVNLFTEKRMKKARVIFCSESAASACVEKYYGK